MFFGFIFIHVPDKPIVGIDQLTRVDEVKQNLIKYFDVSVLTSGAGAMDPHQVLPQDTKAELVAKGRLAVVLVGCKGVPLCCYYLLQDAEVDPINCHETVVEDIAFLSTVKVDLWWLEVAGAGGPVRTGVEKIKAIHATKSR
jgi:hypothetical protein